MVVAVSAQGKLIWRITSLEIREHWEQLRIYLRAASFDLKSWNFGLGSEPAFKCVSCGRFCPVGTATIDHAVPRSQLQLKFIEPNPYGVRIGPFWFGNIYHMYQEGELSVIPITTGGGVLRLHYRVDRPDGTISCFKFVYAGSPPTVLYRWPVSDFLRNLLGNLQPMCAYCNSCKGNRW